MGLPYLRLDFEWLLRFEEVYAFHGAVASMIGRENDLYHQHAEDGSVLYRYPLIQYKRLYRQAAIVGLGEGAEALRPVFDFDGTEVRIKGRSGPLKIAQAKYNDFRLALTLEMRTYGLTHWLALNPENYEAYQAAPGLAQRAALLERVLAAQLLAFASGLGWQAPRPFRAHVQSIDERYTMTYKGVKLTGFSLRFQTDLFLPNYVGLGKGASRGFGLVKELRKRKR